MGGSASVSQIPHELVLNGNNSNQLTLNEEVLSQLRRRSQSLGNANSNSPQVGIKSRAKSSRHQLPSNVKQLLSKIGVDLPIEGGNENRIQTQSTKQLVEHIFDCLGALQHLVKIDQENAPTFEDTRSELVSESQSVIDTNRESVGKLLHEMITIYSLCGDTVKILLQASPDAAAVEDNYGRLALHVAVDRDQPWMDAIGNLIVAYPQALNMRDSGGRLPLHIAVDRDQPCLEVLRLLLAANPQAAMARRGVGRLPLHYAVFSDSPSLEVVRCLVEASYESTNAVDVYGRNCLHYAVDKTSVNIEVVKYLLSVNPSIAAMRDTHSRLPINIALEREVLNLEVVKLLYSAYPQALQEPGPGNKLPLQFLVESQCNNLILIDFIARENSDAIDLVLNNSSSHAMGLPTVRESLNEDASNTDEYTSLAEQSATRSLYTRNPIQEATKLRMATISRYLLFIRPSIDPQRLRDLNWEARKIAFLLARQTDRRPSLIQRLSQRLSHSCSIGNNSNGSPSNSRGNTLIVGQTAAGRQNSNESLQNGGMVPLSPSTSSPAIASKMTIQLFGTAVANALSSSPHNSLTPISQFSPTAINRSVATESTNANKESEINLLNLNLKVGNNDTVDRSEDPPSTVTTSREGEDNGYGEEYNIFGSESDRINSIKNAGPLHPAILAQTAIAIQPRGANRQVQPRASIATYPPQANMYLRLSKLNPDLFRLAVMFL